MTAPSVPVFIGKVTPPADLMDAARKSLSESGFAELMALTGGAIPTPRQIAEAADRETYG